MEDANKRYAVYCIPGLGLNKELFRYLRFGDYPVTFIEWLSPHKNEMLPAYAMRLSQQIDQSKPFVLIGVSFGGMCAIEIAKQLTPVKTIVVSTSKTKHGIPHSLKTLSFLPLHQLFSNSIYIKGAWILRKRFGAHKKIENDFKDTLTPPPLNFFPRAVHMIVNWKNETIPKNVVHIHGSSDKILPYMKKMEYDHTIKDGSHSMILDKAKEIGKIIEEELKKL